MKTDTALTLHAYAKINLTLEILAERDDGYHEISSILQTISLADVFSFELSERIQFDCVTSGSIRADLIENTVLKAANLFKRETGCPNGATIRMESMGIPRSAGLGSSSTDPAAVLKGLNQLWGLNMAPDELRGIASKIGSDTAFFIEGGTALAQGRGENIQTLPLLPKTWIVLLHPSITPTPNKTANLYGLLDSSHFSSGDLTQRLLNELHNSIQLQPYLLCNTFECVAFSFFESLNEYRNSFRAAGAKNVHLAGAGPTLFTLVESEAQGEAMVNRLREQGLGAQLARTV